MTAITQSPKGSGYALSDGKAIYLVDNNGRHARKLRINLQEDTGVYLCYNGSGSHLAICAKCTCGEPRVAITQALWCVNPITAKASKLCEWQQTMLAISDTGERQWFYTDLGGWMEENRILLYTESNWGGESLSDNHCVLLLGYYNIAKRGFDGEKTLYSSDERCHGLVWWPGSKARK